MRRRFIALALACVVLGGDVSAADPEPEAAAPEAITDADEQFWRGFNLLHGRGVERQLAASTEWFRRAAEQGHVRAQVHMGVAYQKGRGVAPDARQALEWFLKAAEQGHSKAQLEAGILYLHARGAEPRDHAEAAKWLLLAYQSGGVMARNSVPPYLKQVSPQALERGRERARQWRIDNGYPVPNGPKDPLEAPAS